MSQDYNICDLATGGGKTHAIGKLSCRYYAKEYDRIVILCVQTRLVDDMEKAIKRYLADSNVIDASQILKVEKNIDIVKNALKQDKVPVCWATL